MKKTRQAAILKLIAEKAISTQDDLSAALCEAGFDAAQATLSRDIKELKLVKTPDEHGRYRYSLPKPDGKDYTKFRSILDDTMLSCEAAGNLAVLKTYSGMGSAAAAAVDALFGDEIVGCIAGDDTILVVLRSEKAAHDFAEQVRRH